MRQFKPRDSSASKNVAVIYVPQSSSKFNALLETLSGYHHSNLRNTLSFSAYEGNGNRGLTRTAGPFPFRHLPSIGGPLSEDARKWWRTAGLVNACHNTCSFEGPIGGSRHFLNYTYCTATSNKHDGRVIRDSSEILDDAHKGRREQSQTYYISCSCRGVPTNSCTTTGEVYRKQKACYF